MGEGGGANIDPQRSTVRLQVGWAKQTFCSPLYHLGNSGTVPRGQRLESALVCLRGSGKHEL